MNLYTDQSIQAKLADGEQVLNHFNLALKCLQLYPANHVTSEQAIDKLWSVLSRFIKAHGFMAFIITRDGLFIEKRPISQKSPAIQSLAGQLYRLKLDQVLIQANIDRRQLVEFLTILCMDIEQIKEAHGLKELLWQREVTAVTVSQASLKLTVEDDPGGPSSDIDTGLKIDNLRQALLFGTDITESERQLIKTELEKGPKELAVTLQKVGSGDAGANAATAILKAVLPKIDGLIKRELADEQVFLYRNLAEALLLLDEPTRTELATIIISSPDHEASFSGRSLVEQMTSEELAELLNLALNTNTLPQISFVNWLETMPVKAERLRDLVPFLKQRLSLDDGAAERLIESKAAQARAAKKSIPVKGADAANIASLAASLRPEDLAKLEAEISGMDESLIETGAIAALAEVLSVEASPARITRVAHAIQRILLSAFEQRRLKTAAAALSAAVAEIERRGEESDIRAILKEIIRDAGTSQRIDGLLAFIESESGVTVEQAVYYISLLRNSGIMTLLDMLALEQRQSRRRLICQLLMACSKVNIASLGTKITDHRWYLVRNVVLVLGQIGDSAAIVYLQKAAGHPDIRVRLEVVKALSNLGPDALPVLTEMIDDKDPIIRLEAVRAMTRTKNREADNMLINIIGQRDWLGRRLDLKLEAIAALGALHSQRAVPYLMKIVKSRALFFKASAERLREAAHLALVKIQEVKHVG